MASALALLLTGCDALTGTDADSVTEAEAETTEAVAAVGKAAGDAAMDIGNDASDWANDSECDDPRFVGEGMAASLVTDNIGHDATDCRNAMTSGAASWQGNTANPEHGVRVM